MNRFDELIIPHDDNLLHSRDDTVLWNKYTVATEDFRSVLENNTLIRQEKELNKKLKTNTCNVPQFRYVFVTLHDLFDFKIDRNWSDINLQTVGCMKYEEGVYKLYPLSCENSASVKLKFNTLMCDASSPHTYVKIYGFCVFYASEEKLIPVAHKDLEGRNPYIEIRVNNWLNLGNLQNARRLEKILYNINYRNDKAI